MANTGFLARVLLFARVVRNGISINEVTVDPGGGPNVTVEQLPAPGDDSPPLPDDYVGAFPSEGSGESLAGGFTDPTNPGTALPGEKRFYARNAAREVISEILMRADGSVIISHPNDDAVIQIFAAGLIVLGDIPSGHYVLFDTSSGLMIVNGELTIDSDGNVITTGTITAADFKTTGDVVTMLGHKHDGTGSLIAPSGGGAVSGRTAVGADLP